MTRLCATPGCVNEVPERSQHEACPNCRAGLRYWHKKRPAQRLERRRKLRMYEARLATLVADEALAEYLRKVKANEP